MKNLYFFIVFVILSNILTAQVKIFNKEFKEANGTYVLSNNPLNKKSIICQYFNLNNKLIYQCEFKTELKEIDTKNFDYYLNNNQIYLDGIYVEYYETGDTSLIVAFKKGNKTGKQLKYRKDKSLEEELNIKNLANAQFSYYGKNGKKLMQFDIQNKNKTGEELHFFDNGNVKLKIEYSPNSDNETLTEYDTDNNVIRIRKSIFEIVESEKCFDNNGNEITCSPLFKNVEILNIREALNDLKSQDAIKSYLKENTITFDCQISEDAKVIYFDASTLPIDIGNSISDWLINRTKWIPSNFAGIDVPSRIKFNISNNDSIYFINKYKYAVVLNNHNYFPSYELYAKQNYEFDTLRIRDVVTENPFVMVEDMPQFEGGSSDNVRIYIAKNLMYPVEAANKKIQGRVYLQFIVDKDGYVKNVTILRGVHPLLDNEAARVVKSMPRWRPGYQKGKAVPVQFTFPVNFELK